MTYWFMRMKQGRGGDDFSEAIWSSGRVGVLFGSWRIHHVTKPDGTIDRDKLRADEIQRVCPQKNPDFNDRFLKTAKPFFCDMHVGDRVVVFFGGKVHMATVGKGFCDDPTPRGQESAFFKCRPIHSSKCFGLEELPSIYRLVQNIGRGTIQKIVALRSAIEILDRSHSAEDVRTYMRDVKEQEFLEMLAPEQWEIICCEYLRDRIGFRLLLLQIGRTLKDVDLVGVTPNGHRVLAQCKMVTSDGVTRTLRNG